MRRFARFIDPAIGKEQRFTGAGARFVLLIGIAHPEAIQRNMVLAALEIHEMRIETVFDQQT